MFLFNISTEHKAFIKKTQTPVFGKSVRHDNTISYFILITIKLSKKTLDVIDRCTYKSLQKKQYIIVNIYIHVYINVNINDYIEYY